MLVCGLVVVEDGGMAEELIARLETRLAQLTGDVVLPYALHTGHHCRDVVTVLAYLKGDPKAGALIKNLPLGVRPPKRGLEMSEKCDVRDVCFIYHIIDGRDRYSDGWCHGERWPECKKREAVLGDPEFIDKMRSIEDESDRQSALLHNEPRG